MNDVGRNYAEAVDALNRRQWSRAFALAQRILQQAGEHAGVHFVAGVAALHQAQMPRALAHLHRAVTLNPRRPDYLAQLARAQAESRLLREAVENALLAMDQQPQDPITLDTLGVVLTQGNEHSRAAEAFKRAAAAMPANASSRFNLATTLTFAGKLDEADSEYEACIALDPGYWKAHLALAQLRKQEPKRNHVERLRSLLAQHQGTEAQLYLNLALSKELEDLGDDRAAFKHLAAGKRAGGNGRNYTSARDEALFAAIQNAFPDPVPTRGGHESAEPIFIIGMPRTGTTLVDRILSSHPQAHSAGELQNFPVLFKRASGSRTPMALDVDAIERATQIDWSRLGEAYVKSTRPGTGHTPFFVDKLPHNFLYAGYIARALPRARIVCLRRDPLDTCLSNFRQLFTLGTPSYDYSFDLLDTGRYYLLFDRLMRHWNQVLPGRLLELDYERIVDDQEGATRELLSFCGLPWDEDCLHFDRNAAPVATASAVQVRNPIFRSSLQRWRRFEPELQELRALLSAAGVALPG